MGVAVSERDVGEIPVLLSTQKIDHVQHDERTREAVDRCFEQYSQDGHLYRRGFIRCLRRLSLSSAVLADRMFHLFDRGLRQYLDREDFQEMFRLLSHSSSGEEDRLIFRLMDPDGSGYVTRSSFREFVTQFFARSRGHERTTNAGAGLPGETIFTALCTIIPSRDIAEYVDGADKYISDVLDEHEQEIVQCAFQNTTNDRIYFDQFQVWNKGRAGIWLRALTAQFIELLVHVDEPEIVPSDEEIDLLKKAITDPDSSGMLNAKVSQHGGTFFKSGTANYTPPSIKFSKKEVNILQRLLLRLSPQGVLSIEKWKQIFESIGIFNTHAVERLFRVFDDDGSRALNAKEFLWGLSAISYGTDGDQYKMPLRFYNISGDGRLSQREFHYFLRSYRNMCSEAVKNASQEIFHVYGIDTVQIDTCDARMQRRMRLDALFSKITEELRLYCADAWECFTKGDVMDAEAFIKFSEAAPAIQGWLKETGSIFLQHVGFLDSYEPPVDVQDVDGGTNSKPLVLSRVKMIETFDKCARASAAWVLMPSLTY